jgi:S-adenosylmethionine decarboxylase
MSVFFEGSEKKLEIHIVPGAGDLRHRGRAFWDQLVASAKAEIISTVQDDKCHSYLLSESSLFVWQDRFVMLTCGNSTLVEALVFFVQSVGKANIGFVSYQRKNEFLSQLQPTSFNDDLKLIRSHIPGKALRVGHLDSHHHYIFYTDTYAGDLGYIKQGREFTSELLMYHISGEMAQYLRSDLQDAAEIRSLLSLDTLFPGFVVDDHLFSPFGYSVNGILGEYYFTIHISPQEQSAYVSIETNLCLEQYPQAIFAHLLKLLMPASWDIISVNEKHLDRHLPAHLCLGSCSIDTSLGYNIYFSHYQQLCEEVLYPEFM